MLNRLKYNEGAPVFNELANITRYMRSKSSEYNQEHPTNDMIANDIMVLSNGDIIIDEVSLKKIEMEQKLTSPHQKNSRRQQQKRQQKGGRKSGVRHNTQKQ